jgi:hypothetical protein
MLQANVMRSLEQEGWKGGRVLQMTCPAGLYDSAQGFLSYILSGRGIPESPERKEPKPLAELAHQPGFV